MQGFVILVLAAAATQTAPVADSRSPAHGAQATALASVTIVRAETSRPDTGADGMARQVRRQADGQVLVEFF